MILFCMGKLFTFGYKCYSNNDSGSQQYQCHIQNFSGMIVCNYYSENQIFHYCESGESRQSQLFLLSHLLP